MNRKSIITTFLAALALAPALLAQSEAGDPYPVGSIAYFNAMQCPAGWTVDDAIAGRTIVPDPKPGLVSGQPLKSGENRVHSHQIRTNVVVTDTSYIAAGGQDRNLGEARSYDVEGQLQQASNNIPYVQLLACRKTSAPVDGLMAPPAVVTFTDTTECAERWAIATGIAGRYLVGLPEGGVPNTAFGGNPLMAGESRQHQHEASGSFTLEPEWVGVGSGCCLNGFAKQASYEYRGSTTTASSGFPYINLRACVPR